MVRLDPWELHSPGVRMGNNVFASLHHSADSKVLNKFTPAEVRLIKATFKDLALRSPGPTIDRNTFLTHFPLPGLHGEQLFEVFDYNHSGAIDFDEFITGLAIACKGSFEERFELVFKIYDITKDGYISPQELRTMLHHVPNEALQLWHLNKDDSGDEDNNAINVTASDSTPSISNNSTDSIGPEITAPHPCFENSLRSGIDADSQKSETGDGVSPQEDGHIKEIIEKLVEAAFGEKNVSDEKKMSFDNFKAWVTKNPEVMVLFNSVFSSFGKRSNTPQNSAFTPPRAFTPPKRSSTPPPSHKHFSIFSRTNSASLRKKELIGDQARSSSSTQLHAKEKENIVTSIPRSANSYSARLNELNNSPSPGKGDTNGNTAKQVELDEDNDCHQCKKEGTLYKVGRRSKRMQNRYYKLYGNILYYYSSERSTTPSGVIMMSGCFVDPLDLTESKYFGLKIVTGKGGERDERILYTKAKEERDNWIVVLRQASRDRKFTKQYVLKHKIGTGKFSNVYLCKSKATGTEYAVKLIKKDHLSDDEKELLRTEIAILRLVEHPFIVRLIDVFETVENMYLVMELLKGGELYHCIVGRPRFSADEAYVLLKQLMEGISYLHSAGIVHRDMKPENILLSKPIPKGSRLDSSFQVKLADFGLSKLVAPNEILKLPCGTISYVAPEVLSQEGYGIEADNWSIGVIMYLVIRGKLPFNSEEKDAIIKEILSNDIDWKKDPVFSRLEPGLVEILQGLLEKDKSKRMTASDVLSHTWMLKMSKREGHNKSTTASDSTTLKSDISTVSEEAKKPPGEQATTREATLTPVTTVTS